MELSLVDNPANQLANVFSIQKSATGPVTVKGMLAETEIENVFICKNDDYTVSEGYGIRILPNVRYEDGECWMVRNRYQTVLRRLRILLAKFLTPADKEAAPISNSEGGVEVGKDETSPNPVTTPRKSTYQILPRLTQTERRLRKRPRATVEEEEAKDVDETAGTEEAMSSQDATRGRRR